VAVVKAAFLEMSGPGFPQIFRVTSTDTFHAQQAIRPVSIALGTFGAIAGLAALLLAAQALGRHLQAEREQRAVARALGASPLATSMAAAVGPAVAVIIGVALAVLLAIVASPAMPVGAVRRVEVNRGVDIDWMVLGLGSLLLIVVLLAMTAYLSWREAPHRVLRRSRLRRRSSGRVAAGAGHLPVPVTTGLRLAFERGEGATAVPVRSVMGGAVIAVAALVAAITFGASLTRLVDHPRLFGWDWNITLIDQAGYGNTKPGPTADILGHDPDVEAWSGAFFGAAQIDGQNVPILGMDVGSPVTPPLREGRMIRNDQEIVLGSATMDQLHKHIGDTVETSSGNLRIVGTATLPTIGQVHGGHTSLGIGALMETTRVPGYDRNITGTGEYGPNVLFVRTRPGADEEVVRTRLGEASAQISDSGGLAVTLAQRPSEIVNANDIGSSPTILGVAVALSALSALVLALTAAVRRRRRDLALLKALGFTRRQLSATVAWQATGTVLVGLVVGVPAGVAFGRVLWGLFARQLDVLAEPTTPLVLIAVVILATLVIANVLSAIPARFARTVPVALVLRSE
jgi:predicted lysophospholipase L1 biosynthesis ABC-type transport system permease subunit